MMKRKRLNHLILAEGEVTGHAHRASGGVLYELEDGSMELMPAAEGTRVSHEEHAVTPALTEPFRVTKVQEYDHAAEEARGVAD